MRKEESGSMWLAAFVLLTIPLVMLFKAIVLVSLWGWFVVPLGVVTIGYAHALGLAFIAEYALYSHKEPYKNDKTNNTLMLDGIWRNFLGPWAVLLLGYVIHLFM